MAYAFSFAARYQDMEVQTADPLGLVVLLYQGAVRQLRRAEQALEANQTDVRVDAINRALAIIGELQASLDHQRGGEIARSLDRLYTYMTRQLTTANLRRSRRELSEVRSLLETLLSAWEEAHAKQEASAKTSQPTLGSLPDQVSFQNRPVPPATLG
ncbi:MAG: flagellar export chaperone FliS [Acidobacteriota bacterium]